jgi:hypothetical protein
LARVFWTAGHQYKTFYLDLFFLLIIHEDADLYLDKEVTLPFELA